MGRKLGMTQVFDAAGHLQPITVISIPPSVVVRQITNKNGYQALVLGFEKTTKPQNKPHTGQFQKCSPEQCYRFLYESRDTTLVAPGQLVSAKQWFQPGTRVDVTGLSKGKGMTGVIKRHNQSRGPKTHGSHHYRRPGSSGAIINRVFKNRALPGRKGHQTRTSVGVWLVHIAEEPHLIFIRGSVPGPNKGLLWIKHYAGAKRNTPQQSKIMPRCWTETTSNT